MSRWLREFISYFTKNRKTSGMVTTSSLRAVKKFKMGYFIKEQLDLLDWTEQKLVDEMNITENELTSILAGGKKLSQRLAQKLSELFGPSPQYWINIDYRYRQWVSV